MYREILQKNLNHTSKLLASTEEGLKRCQYALSQRDFIISEQRKAGMLDFLFCYYLILVVCTCQSCLNFYTENALARQACELQSDLEKSLQDNASLFSKIGMNLSVDLFHY